MRQKPVVVLILAVLALVGAAWWFTSGIGDSDPSSLKTGTERGQETGGAVSLDGQPGVDLASAGEEAGEGSPRSMRRLASNSVRVFGRLTGVTKDWSEAKVYLAKQRPKLEDAIFEGMRKGFDFKNIRSSGKFDNLGEAPVPLVSANAKSDGSFSIDTDLSGDFDLHVEHRLLRISKAVAFSVAKSGAEGAKREYDLGDVPCVVASALIVFVEDHEGQPVAGAKIMLSRPFDPMSMFNFKTGMPDFSRLGDMVKKVQDKTDKRGMVRIGGLKSGGTATVVSRVDGHGPAHLEVTLMPGREQVVRLRLPAEARLALSIRDEKKSPVGHASVSVQPIQDDELGTRIDDPRRRKIFGRSDDKGAVLIASLPSGPCRVTIKARGFVSFDREVRLQSGETAERSFVLDRGASVSGVVVDDVGQPVVGASVGSLAVLGQKVLGMKISSMVPDVALDAASRDRGEKTDEKGRFTLAGLERDAPVDLVVAKTGYSTTTSDAKCGDRDLKIVLDRQASVVGRVVREEDQSPLAEFTARVVKTSFLVLQTKQGVQTDLGEGRFRLEGLKLGRQSITVEAPGRAPLSTNVNLTISEDGKPMDIGDIVMSPPSALTGIVVDDTGEPVEGAKVRVAKGGIGDIAFLAKMRGDQEALTDEEGRFTLTALPARRMRLRIEKSGYAMKRSKTIRVERAKTTGPVKIVLDRGAIVEGVVLDAKRQPLAGWMVTLQNQSIGVSKTQRSDTEGKLRFEAIAEGNYRVEAVPQDFVKSMSQTGMRFGKAGGKGLGKLISDAMSKVVASKVEVSGSHAKFELIARERVDASSNLAKVQGRVTIGNAPLESGLVEFHALGDSRQAFTNVTAGRYEMLGLAPGKYRVRLRSGLLRSGSRDSRIVTVPESGTATVDLELPSGVIRGVVQSKDGKPIAFSLVRIRRTDDNSSFDPSEMVEIGYGVSITGEDGTFDFEGLAAGSYSVIARQMGGLEGAKSGRSALLQLGEGQELRKVKVMLEAGASLRVLVRGSDGAPVKGALVRALDSSGSPLASFQASRSDGSGEAVLRGLAAGVYRVLVNDSDHASTVSDLIPLRSAQELSHVARLRTGIEVRAHFAGKVPVGLAGQRVAYSIWDSQGRLVRSGILPVPPGFGGTEQKRFLPLGRLEPGSYKARLESMQFGVIEKSREVPTRGNATWDFVLNEK